MSYIVETRLRLRQSTMYTLLLGRSPGIFKGVLDKITKGGLFPVVYVEYISNKQGLLQGIRNGYIRNSLYMNERRTRYEWDQTFRYKTGITCFDRIEEGPKDRETDRRHCKRHFNEFTSASTRYQSSPGKRRGRTCKGDIRLTFKLPK
jgi:hypothetical protein